MTAPFDLTGPLPRGTTILEASAGTGKTYTIEALATRFVAEGSARLTDLLVMTYGRAASAEMRERIRSRMVATRDALADPAGAPVSADPVVRHLAAGSAADVALRAHRLTDALAHFDEATIATTHQVCQRTLVALGIGADVDPNEVFVENLTELVDEVVADVYVRTYGRDDATPPEIGVAEARGIALAVVNDPQAFLDVPPPAAGSGAAERLAFAVAVRADVDRRRRERSMVTYHDLVGRLAQALSAGPDCARNREWLRVRYRVVMVDEFQDTDPLQWQILRDAFHGHSDLILIGDPKQAIYGFRGGDVVTYLVADGHAHQRLTLGQNHRSDRRLVAAIGDFFGDLPLGDPRIRLHPVTGQQRTRLRGSMTADPIRLRLVPERLGKALKADAAREQITADLAADVHRLVTGDTQIDDGTRWRPVAPGDVAILVRRWADADAIAEALQAHGIRIVRTGDTSVFATPAARDWLALLRAIDQPHRRGLLRTAMLTPMLGYRGDQLGTDGDRHADEAAALLRAWGDDLHQGGIAALLGAVTTEGSLMTSGLRQADGERQLTDLRHVGEALHEQSQRTKGVAALADWLAARIREASSDRREQVQRRVDSDADAVQVLTVFGAKGLQFPIVYVPHAWNRYPEIRDGILRYHTGDRRMLDVLGHDTPDWKVREAHHFAEEAGESLRMLYVAMTRAICQVVLWWAPTARSTDCSALSRVLGARITGDTEPADEYRRSVITVPNLAGIGVPATLITGSATATSALTPVSRVPAPTLELAPFDRVVDTTWRRTSYSGLTQAAHEYAFAHETVTGERDDEPAPQEAEEVAATSPRQELLSPMGDLPKGATFGTAVHHALEVVVTAGPDLDGELLRACRTALTAHPVAGVTPTAMSAALAPALATPLGDLAGDTTLWQIPTTDRLPELDFEFPLGPSGDPASTAAAQVLLGHVGDLMRTHLAADDPLAAYPDRIDRDRLAPVRLQGYLSGSIDAVFRVQTGDATPRFLVADYKTNWIGPASSGALPVSAFQTAAMADAMLDAHYPLQALLYCVALHRYLRWRLPGYDPGTHLGGVLYLFLRGMAGPDTPRPPGAAAPYGVFSWQPGADLVVAVSDLLAGRRS